MEYLYHCAGCKKDDTEYPDVETKCNICEGEYVSIEINNDNITKIMCKKCKLEKSVLIIPKFKKELINKFEREINKNEN